MAKKDVNNLKIATYHHITFTDNYSYERYVSSVEVSGDVDVHTERQSVRGHDTRLSDRAEQAPATATEHRTVQHERKAH